MNALEEESLILARLRAQIPVERLAHVASVASIVGTVNLAPLLPAVFLEPGPAPVTSGSADGRALHEEPEWFVVLALAHVPDPVALTATYQAAGELLGDIIEALAGWQPAARYRPMKYAGRLDPAEAPGHIEFPLRFTVKRSFSGTGGTGNPA